MVEETNIVFLHIPKTAGQSVHHFLTDLFATRSICPSRVNEQLLRLSISDIRRYTLFSGHFDWALLDCLLGQKFVFTILREPTDRILSFYFFLRKSAEALPADKLALPQHQGLKAALHLPCDEYFLSGEPGLRAFLDNHYDNFYAHYLAGRTYDARQRLVGQKRADSTFTDQRILEIALQNIASLDGVYCIDRLDLLERDLRNIDGARVTTTSLTSLQINRGDSGSLTSRIEKLRELGATDRTFDRIQQMTALDNVIWERVRDSLVPSRNNA